MDLPPLIPHLWISSPPSPARNTGELMPPSRISLLPVRLSLALFVNLKLLQRRFISDPEVHLMGSELIGFLLSSWLSLNPDDMLFSFGGFASFCICLFSLFLYQS